MTDINEVRSDVLAAVTMKVTVFLCVTPFCLERLITFRKELTASIFRLEDSSSLKIETVYYSKRWKASKRIHITVVSPSRTESVSCKIWCLPRWNMMSYLVECETVEPSRSSRMFWRNLIISSSVCGALCLLLAYLFVASLALKMEAVHSSSKSIKLYQAIRLLISENRNPALTIFSLWKNCPYSTIDFINTLTFNLKNVKTITIILYIWLLYRNKTEVMFFAENRL